jgi:hypothetical protein
MVRSDLRFCKVGLKSDFRLITSPPVPLSKVERGRRPNEFPRLSPLSVSERGFRGEVKEVSFAKAVHIYREL